VIVYADNRLDTLIKKRGIPMRLIRLLPLIAVSFAGTMMLAGCTKPSSETASTAASKATAETADQFVERLNRELLDISKEVNAAGWTYNTYINQDTELLQAKAGERLQAFLTNAILESKRYDGQQLKPETRRAIDLLKLSATLPAPNDVAKRAELSRLSAKLEGMYGSAKYCPPGVAKDSPQCKDQGQLVNIMANSRKYDELLDAWTGWHNTSREMRDDYARIVQLGNEGASEIGYKDLGVLWRAGYDMPADDFSKVATHLWDQVKPLYNELHCYTRNRLQKTYGADKVQSGKPIPAHLLGNMWAQSWGEIYPLLEPYKGVNDLNVTAALKAQKYDEIRIARQAESFYTSLGFQALPDSFWKRSLLKQPKDRDVQCHASAWQLDGKDDVRIKQCIEPNQEELYTTYHELGHVFYYLSYMNQPFIFQAGAHDGVHEAIGDTINLSMTPAYLHQVGLAGVAKESKEAVINQQMKVALDKIAFLPFGKMIDEWRWRVFSGDIKPADYNKSWWKIREQYQGIAPPIVRGEENFDPGAKYHVAANVPYTRYFLSYIVQFQFHKALCEAAGFKGPLHECSIYGNKEAGKKYQAMLARGASQPWQDTLAELTGTREMDASAIIEYFDPLMSWLKEQNKGQQCGWGEN
jgi:peptidyl-dipeptidase A